MFKNLFKKTGDEKKVESKKSDSTKSSVQDKEVKKTAAGIAKVPGKENLDSSKQAKTKPETAGKPAGFGEKTKTPSSSGSVGAANLPAAAASTRMTRVEANDHQVREILSFQGNVLTAPGGDLPTSDQQRQVIAILEDGTVIVAKGDNLNPNVVAVKAMAKKTSIMLRRELTVDLDVIRKVYENAKKREGSDERTNDAAKMQKDFIDLVKQAQMERCSDIHVIVQRFEAVVRMRSDGVMKTFRQLPANYAADMLAAAFAMADASDPSYKPYDYQGARVSEINAPLPQGVQAVRLQFNPLPNGGRYLIARLLYAQATDSGMDIDTLGYSQVHIRDIKTMRRKPFGINVISGPTGSGKSTTLQRALSALMEEKRFQINVITIEDPPEYVITGAAQLPVTNAQTDEERNEKFRQAISASLRSDPDVIMIGEIRDRASSALAFAAAMTGHQVWASLHANDAISILDRFRDQGVELYKLTDHTLITGLVGQRLMRALCPHCKIPLEDVIQYEDNRILSKDIVEALHSHIGSQFFDKIFIADENGCDRCKKGYSGRTVVAECIVPDPMFMKHVAVNDKAAAVKHWLDNLEGLTMLEHAVQKMLAGIADPRDVEDRVGVLTELDLERRKHVFGMIGIDVSLIDQESSKI